MTQVTDEIRRYLLKKSVVDVCLSIFEIILNTINGKISLSDKLKNKLKKYKSELRNLINHSISIRKKRKILIRAQAIIKIILKNFLESPVSKIFKNGC